MRHLETTSLRGFTSVMLGSFFGVAVAACAPSSGVCTDHSTAPDNARTEGRKPNRGGKAGRRGENVATEGGARSIVQKTKLEAIEWLSERGYSASFGHLVAFDGGALMVGSLPDVPHQRSSIDIFEVQRGRLGIVGAVSVGHFNSASRAEGLGRCVLACAGGFLASGPAGRLLWFTGRGENWHFDLVEVVNADERDTLCPVACNGNNALTFVDRGLAREVAVQQILSGKWVANQRIAAEPLRFVSGTMARSWGALGGAGQIQVYRTTGQWELEATLDVPGIPVAMASTEEWLFVSIQVDRVNERVLSYRRRAGAWQRTADFEPGGGGLAAHQGVLVVGDNSERRGSLHQVGVVRIYEEVAGAWRQTGTVNSPYDIPGQYFGARLALAYPDLVVGAPGHDRVAGAVYFFRIPPPTLAGSPAWSAVASQSISPRFYSHGGYVWE